MATLDLTRDLSEWRDAVPTPDRTRTLADILHTHAKRMVFYGPNIVFGTCLNGRDLTMVPALTLSPVAHEPGGRVAHFTLSAVDGNPLTRTLSLLVAEQGRKPRSIRVLFDSATTPPPPAMNATRSLHSMTLFPGDASVVAVTLLRAMEGWINRAVGEADASGRPIRPRRGPSL